jgi:Ti-type conjugative transfer relaxase TraA
MAAFHFCAKIHSRANGASAVRAAAYRAAERLYDDRAGKHEDYTLKSDVARSTILAPSDAPDWVHTRKDLWNRAEAAERRRDSQVAQELEINLPRELDPEDNWRLICDFAREHLVAHGRICDINMHLGQASDGEAHPHAHLLMPVRALDGGGFGEKHPDCSWKTFVKRRDRLNELRAVWCEFARERARELGHDLGSEWDHRSFEARGIDLEAQPKRGATAQRLDRRADRAPAERTTELLAAIRRNGAQLLRNPSIALHALTQQHSTFSEADLARYIHRHCAEDQFAAIMAAARPLTVEVGRDMHGRQRFSTEAMAALERRMVDNAAIMAEGQAHTVGRRRVAWLRGDLSDQQREAAAHLLTAGDLACLTGYAGSGKSTLLRAAREAWQVDGYTVRGAALSGIAAEGLRTGSGIEARTIASLTRAWERGTERLTAKDVLIVDEAGMIGSRQLAELVERCREAGAKLVLVGDPEQLQAISAGAAYRAIAERVGARELTEIWRQRETWQREATRAFADGRTAEALASYRDAGCIDGRRTDDDARLHLVERWLAGRLERPDASRIMLAHTNNDVTRLNAIARDLSRAEGQLGLDERTLDTNAGARAFATGDRLLFRRNDRRMDVRNGTIGTVTELEPGRMGVRLDDGRMVAFDPAAYRDIDHGYAVTVHKAQGVTVDESYILATRGFDRHLAYVAGTRHRDRMTMVWSEEAFKDDRELSALLRRERAKDTTLDYHEASVERAEEPGRSTERERSRRDGPSPRPTQNFIDAHLQVVRKRPVERDEVADAWAAFGVSEETPERVWERQRARDLGLER